jgi:hypothetical protein
MFAIISSPVDAVCNIKMSAHGRIEGGVHTVSGLPAAV